MKTPFRCHAKNLCSRCEYNYVNITFFRVILKFDVLLNDSTFSYNVTSLKLFKMVLHIKEGTCHDVVQG